MINAPTILGLCQDLILESSSYAYGSLKYQWEHLNDGEHEYCLDIEYLLGNLSETTSSVTIPAILIEPGNYLN